MRGSSPERRVAESIAIIRAMPSPARPLIVRLRNWVGDVILGVPMLQRLQREGYSLQLVGKRWAVDLLAGSGWPVHVQPPRWRERIAQLRRLAASSRMLDPDFDRRINAVALPYSLSSALEMRIAGLRAIGHAHEGRSLLLARAVAHPRKTEPSRRQHELAIYWDLGNVLLGQEAPRPDRIALQPSAQQSERAHGLIEEQGLRPGFIVICPFAGGTFAGQDKTWPEFPDFARSELAALGRDIVICPGPGEEEQAERDFGGTRILRGIDLGTYAALLGSASLMVSNDTGPGHLAASVGTPLVSVLGPSDPAQWRAWGPTVHLVQGEGGWPRRQDVDRKIRSLLRP
jgi:heptosyltransferase-2